MEITSSHCSFHYPPSHCFFPDKATFDEKMTELQAQLDVAVVGNIGVQKEYEEFKERETATITKVQFNQKC